MVSTLRALGLDGEDGAGLDRLAVDMDDAGAALAGVAADVGAGHAEILAQELNQQRARLDLAGDGLAVHGHGDGNGHYLLPHIVGMRALDSARLPGRWPDSRKPVRRRSSELRDTDNGRESPRAARSLSDQHRQNRQERATTAATPMIRQRFDGRAAADDRHAAAALGGGSRHRRRRIVRHHHRRPGSGRWAARRRSPRTCRRTRPPASSPCRRSAGRRPGRSCRRPGHRRCTSGGSRRHPRVSVTTAPPLAKPATPPCPSPEIL